MSAATRNGSKKPRPAPDEAQLKALVSRPKPHAMEAEVAVLGGMILDPQVIGDVIQIIKSPEDFHRPAHSAIYETLVELYEQAIPADDMVELHQRLRDKQQLDGVGGVDYLIELSEAVTNPGAAPRHARVVREKAVHRQLLDALNRCYYEAHESGQAVSELLDHVEREIFEVAHERGEGSDTVTTEQLMQDALATLEANDGRTLTGVETGFHELDDLLGGLQPADMVVLAARPSMGKTALALAMADHIAIANKQPAAVFSLEMSRQQLGFRLLSSRAGVSSHRLRRNMLSDNEFERINIAAMQIGDAPLLIDDSTNSTIMRLRAKARRLSAQHSIKALFIDYLQLMSAPGAESRQQEVSMISRGIKALARELNVPVICLSQLNRNAEGRANHRPQLSDLRESGSIEQDADVVMLLHREEYYHRDEPEWAEQNPDKTNVAELIVAKQRNGPIGTVKLHFRHDQVRFANLAGTPQPSMY